MARFERSARPAAGGRPTPDGRPTVKMRLDPAGRWQVAEEPPAPTDAAAEQAPAEPEPPAPRDAPPGA